MMVSSACVKLSKIRSRASRAMPMPVSDTSKRRRARVSSPPTRSSAITTEPASVNFTALLARLRSTSWRWRWLPSTAWGVRAVTWVVRRTPFDRAWAVTMPFTSRTSPWRSRGPAWAGMRPASMREKSRMPLMRERSVSAELESVSTMSSCSPDRRVSRSRLDMPMMALSGVRSSWLTLARNRLFARLASSACRLASDSLRIRFAQ
jgi:hypothetical protein